MNRNCLVTTTFLVSWLQLLSPAVQGAEPINRLSPMEVRHALSNYVRVMGDAACGIAKPGASSAAYAQVRLITDDSVPEIEKMLEPNTPRQLSSAISDSGISPPAKLRLIRTMTTHYLLSGTRTQNKSLDLMQALRTFGSREDIPQITALVMTTRSEFGIRDGLAIIQELGWCEDLRYFDSVAEAGVQWKCGLDPDKVQELRKKLSSQGLH